MRIASTLRTPAQITDVTGMEIACRTLGDEADSLTGIAYTQTLYADIAGFSGLEARFIDMGAGDDTATGELLMTDFGLADANSYAGLTAGDVSFMRAGTGADTLHGRVLLYSESVASEVPGSIEMTALELTYAFLGDGSDTASADVVFDLSRDDSAAATGVRFGGPVDLGGGADTLLVTVTDASGPQSLDSTLFGVQGALIDFGEGDDTVRIQATATSGGTGASLAVALDGSLLQLGSGDDFVFLRGDDLGMRDGAISGGSGIDRFDLQAATGSVDGGAGIDGLALEAGLGSLTVSENAGTLTLTGAGDDLDVTGVEFFLLG